MGESIDCLRLFSWAAVAPRRVVRDSNWAEGESVEVVRLSRSLMTEASIAGMYVVSRNAMALGVDRPLVNDGA